MRLKNLVLATAVSGLALACASTALAQRNTAASVLIVNYQRLAAESALGRDMQTKIQGVGAQIQQQVQAMQTEGESIQQEQDRLAAATRGMTSAQVQASATLRPQIEAFQQRRQQFQTRFQALQGDMQCTQAIAVRDFENQIRPILTTAMQARGAGAIVDTSGVRAFDPQYDVTNTVIQQLDQNPSTRTATVARHAVAECQPAQPAAAAH